jgi:hypothetical protein
MGSMRTPRRKRWLFSLVVLAGALLCAEGVGRLLFERPIHAEMPSANPRLIYELNPSYPGINSLGMRQDEIDPSTLRHQFVIAVIGDSHTYSIGSADRGHAFPARLAHHLDAPGNGITVLNFGVPGYNMAQELEVLRTKALPFAPDLIILQYTINDEHISNYIQPGHPWLNRAIHRSVLLTNAWTSLLYSDAGKRRLVPLVEDHAPDLLLYAPGLVGSALSREQDPARRRHPARSRDLVPPRYHDFIGRDNLERAVATFGDVCRKEGIPALATGFIEEGDAGLYRTSGFLVYTFFDMFNGLDMRPFGYDPARTDGHFSDRGNEFIGHALAGYIRDHFSLRPHGR